MDIENNTCRICLNLYNEDFISLYCVILEDLSILDCLQIAFSIELKMDLDFPQFICSDCCDKIKRGYELKIQSKKAEVFLKEKFLKTFQVELQKTTKAKAKAQKDLEKLMADLKELNPVYYDEAFPPPEEVVPEEEIVVNIDEEVKKEVDPIAENGPVSMDVDTAEGIDLAQDDSMDHDYGDTAAADDNIDIPIDKEPTEPEVDKDNPEKDTVDTVDNPEKENDNEPEKEKENDNPENPTEQEKTSTDPENRPRVIHPLNVKCFHKKCKGDCDCHIVKSNLDATMEDSGRIVIYPSFTNPPLVYKCYICNKDFALKIYKTKHVREDHKIETSEECRICKYMFKSSKKLEKHLYYHENPPNYVCELCGKAYLNKANLEFHLHMHNSTVRYYCDYCNISFKYKENLRRHVRLHAKNTGFTCNECKLTYTTLNALNSHMYKIHDVEAPIKCSDCGRGYSFMSELKNHKNRFGKCPSTRDRLNYKSHHLNMIVDPGKKKFFCNLCKKNYKHLPALKLHMKYYHSQSKEDTKCEICNKEFSNVGNLRRHRIIHTDIKPFKCEFCDKGFDQKAGYIIHRRIHTGEKPYECSKCSRKFADPSCYYKHMKNVHKSTKKDSSSDS